MAADPITTEAIDTLRAAVATLVPAIAGGSVTRAVSVVPTRIRPVGLGGYVGTERVIVDAAEVIRELPVRRVEAQVGVVIRADTEAGAESGVAAASAGLLGADRKQMRELGLLRLVTHEPGAARAETAPGGGAPFVRELRFSVEYEFVKRVTPTEGVIEQIPLKTTTDGREETTVIGGGG